MEDIRRFNLKHITLLFTFLTLAACGGGGGGDNNGDGTSEISQWSRQLGTNVEDIGYSITTDASGNVYVTGSTAGDLDGNISSGDKDLFVTKYNSSGAKQWTQQFGTDAEDIGYGITTDASGNVYVTGSTVGNLDGNTPNIGSTPLPDIFIVKYDSSGVRQWTRQFGTLISGLGIFLYLTDEGRSITSDASGNVYVTGSTWGNLDGNTPNFTQPTTADIFIVKYDSSGTEQWTRQLGGTHSVPTAGIQDFGHGIATDTSNNVYVTGYTAGDLDGNTNSDDLGLLSGDLVVIKYDSSGAKQWTRQLGTNVPDRSYGIATDTNDNIYITGSTDGGLDGNISSGGSDLFVVKYSSSGVKQWTQQSGTALNEFSYSITTDASGNVYVTGFTAGSLDGNAIVGGITDIFVIKYDSSGAKQWTKQLGTNLGEQGNGIATDNNGNVYITGLTDGELDGNTHSGGFDMFVIKLK